MARLLEHPKFVPCPACGNTVNVSTVEVSIKAGKGTIVIQDVPQYECECGSLFVPQETENIIASLQQDKSIQAKGKVKIRYSDLRKKGINSIKKRLS